MRPSQAQREALGIRLTTTEPAKEKHEGLSQLRAEGATQRAQYYWDGVFGAQRSAGAGHFLTAVFGGLLNPLHPATPGLSTGSVGHSCLGHSGLPPSLISSFGFFGKCERASPFPLGKGKVRPVLSLPKGWVQGWHMLYSLTEQAFVG